MFGPLQYSFTNPPPPQLVDHYHNKRDGLPCRLTEPVPNPDTTILELKSECMHKHRHPKAINECLFPVTFFFLSQSGLRIKNCLFS